MSCVDGHSVFRVGSMPGRVLCVVWVLWKGLCIVG